MSSLTKNLIATAIMIAATMSANGEIISVDKMSQVQEKIENLLKNHSSADILAAFDIDMTLTQPNHPAVYYPTLIKYGTIYKDIMASLSDAQRDLVLMHMVYDLPQKLVEEETPKIIKTLQNKGLKLIAFTASLTGPIGPHEQFERYRYEHLKTFGINFDKTFSTQEISLKDLPPYRGQYPVFYKGVLCANGEKGKTSKGSVLVTFLHAAQINPKIVILIDDKKKNLEDVASHLHSTHPDIQFIGIEYKGAFAYAPKTISDKEFKAFWQGMADKATSKS